MFVRTFSHIFVRNPSTGPPLQPTPLLLSFTAIIDHLRVKKSLRAVVCSQVQR
jgi:hypothetical protein